MKNLAFRLATSLLDLTGDSTATDILNETYKKFKEIMGTVLPVVIGVILLVGMFFGIKLGITFAKAEDADARDKAKGQLVNLCIGVGVAAVIMIIVMILVNANVFEGLFKSLAGGAQE